MAPVFAAWRFPLAAGIGARVPAQGFRRWSFRSVLIAGQVAVSTVLLVATMLFVRSLWVASQVDPGFDLDRVATIELDTRTGQFSDEQVVAYQRATLARLRDLPNVSGVSAASVVPLSMESVINSVEVDLRGHAQSVRAVNNNWILPDYFRVMGIAFREGRDLTEADRQTKPRAVVVNEAFAKQVFAGGSAIGGRIRRPSDDNSSPWAEIVGVVADSRYRTLGEEPRPLIYWPFSPDERSMTIHVRTDGDARSLVRELPGVLAAWTRVSEPG